MDRDRNENKDKLLRELLSEPLPGCGDSSTLLQLLNSRRKRKSAVCSKNPALADLLARPTSSGTALPPPSIPNKWHQEPREKLPRKIMKKYLPPHPADRSGIPLEDDEEDLGSSDISGPSVNVVRPFQDRELTLSDILDQVIDFQEKTPPNQCAAATAAAISSAVAEVCCSSSQPMASQNASIISRMNELLEVVPPNVCIRRDFGKDTGDSLVKKNESLLQKLLTE